MNIKQNSKLLIKLIQHRLQNFCKRLLKCESPGWLKHIILIAINYQAHSQYIKLQYSMKIFKSLNLSVCVMPSEQKYYIMRGLLVYICYIDNTGQLSSSYIILKISWSTPLWSLQLCVSDNINILYNKHNNLMCKVQEGFQSIQ